MNEQTKTKVLLVSRDHSVFRFFMNLFAPEPLDLLRCSKPVEAEKSVSLLKPAVILFHVDNPDDLPLIRLSRILVRTPVPTLLVSSAPDSIPETISRGLNMGASDIITLPGKTGSLSPHQKKRIVRTVISCSSGKAPLLSYKDIVSVMHDRTYQGRAGASFESISAADTLRDSCIDVVGLAISTGGPSALSRFIPSLPEAFPPPILVVQHIIPGFISNVATRLNSTCAVKVKIAEDGENLQGGTVYFAPDGYHLKMSRKRDCLAAALSEEPSNVLFRPSADILFESMVECCGSRCMGIIMTGMGKDGVEGIRLLKQAGGVTMAQDKQSSAIYGMARIAVDENLIDHVVPLDKMAGEIFRIIVRDPQQNPGA